jgi:DNA-binding Lrp family transcriptional regulator
VTDPLDEQIRELYLKTGEDELTYRDIAKKLGVSEQRVHDRIGSMHRWGELPYRSHPNKAFVQKGAK